MRVFYILCDRARCRSYSGPHDRAKTDPLRMRDQLEKEGWRTEAPPENKLFILDVCPRHRAKKGGSR